MIELNLKEQLVDKACRGAISKWLEAYEETMKIALNSDRTISFIYLIGGEDGVKKPDEVGETLSKYYREHPDSKETNYEIKEEPVEELVNPDGTEQHVLRVANPTLPDFETSIERVKPALEIFNKKLEADGFKPCELDGHSLIFNLSEFIMIDRNILKESPNTSDRLSDDRIQ